MDVLKTAKEAMRIEAESILLTEKSLDKHFKKVAELILNIKGRVILTGMGKSGQIAGKIASTLASTGTPAFFLHPGEAIHGDLGKITSYDIVFMLSNSGETEEIINLIPSIEKIGATVIVMTGCKNSTLAQKADVVLPVVIKKEADEFNMVPTSSSTTMLAIGDALAITLMKLKSFTSERFALYHPGGTLGKKMLMTVKQIMHSGKCNPTVKPTLTVQEALFVMTAKGLGAVSIIDEEGKLKGILTDGDIRRGLEKHADFLKFEVKDVMIKNPIIVHPSQLLVNALELMKSHKPNPVTVLPVCEKDEYVCGMIHLTDLLKQGVL